MNTQKRHQTVLLALAALLTLPAGLQAAELDATAGTQLAATETPSFNSVGNQPVDSPSVLHIPGDETNIGTPAEVRDATARATGSGPVDLSGSGSVDVRLNTDSATDTIQATAFAARDQALNIAERGVNEGRVIAGAIESSASRLEAEARSDVEKAMLKANQARDRLNQAIERGRNATERRWDNARDEIAERYEELANSLEKARDTAAEKGARLDAQAAGNVNGSVRRGS
jgi:hypothetical protein